MLSDRRSELVAGGHTGAPDRPRQHPRRRVVVKTGRQEPLATPRLAADDLQAITYLGDGIPLVHAEGLGLEAVSLEESRLRAAHGDRLDRVHGAIANVPSAVLSELGIVGSARTREDRNHVFGLALGIDIERPSKTQCRGTRRLTLLDSG